MARDGYLTYKMKLYYDIYKMEQANRKTVERIEQCILMCSNRAQLDILHASHAEAVKVLGKLTAQRKYYEDMLNQAGYITIHGAVLQLVDG